MAEADQPITPAENESGDTRTGAAPEPPRSSGKRTPRSSKRRGGQGERNVSRRRARVLAMQALFEDDLTGHGLDAILQHLGERERREHGDYFARVRADARKAVEEIGFLARNTDNDALDHSVADFQRTADDVLAGLFAVPEPAEGEPIEHAPSRDRKGLEKELRAVLTDYRNGAERILRRVGTQHPILEDEAREGELAALQARASRQLEETLTTAERTSREAVMERLGRTVTLARGVNSSRDEIDPHIERAAPAFPMPQLASIDRVVLRLAVYELLFEPEVPFKVAINEAVDIAKTYGGPNSGRFVNGVLRTISEGLPESRKNAPAPG